MDEPAGGVQEELTAVGLVSTAVCTQPACGLLLVWVHTYLSGACSVQALDGVRGRMGNKTESLLSGARRESEAAYEMMLNPLRK